MAGKSPYDWPMLQEKFKQQHIASGGKLTPTQFLTKLDIPHSTGKRYINKKLIQEAAEASEEASKVVAKSEVAEVDVAVKEKSRAKDEQVPTASAPALVSGAYSSAYFNECKKHCEKEYNLETVDAEIAALQILHRQLFGLVSAQIQAVAEERLSDAMTLRSVSLSKTQMGKAVSESWSIDTFIDHFLKLSGDLISAKEKRKRIEKLGLEIKRLQNLGNDLSGNELVESLLNRVLGMGGGKKQREGLLSEYADEQ